MSCRTWLSALVLVQICFHFSAAQNRSGIPEIDSLPLNDWQVTTHPLSYSKALAWSLFLPGGGQFYGGHPIRGSFLVGLEGILIGDGFFSKKSFLDERRSDYYHYRQEASREYQRFADSAGQISLSQTQFYKNINLAREAEDLLVTQGDLGNSEIAWGLGLHLYGILDAMEIVYRSRHPQGEKKSVRSALYRGLLFPGAGQLYNNRYGKFGLLWMGLSASAISAYSRQQVVDHFQERVQQAKQESSLNFASGRSSLTYLDNQLTLYRKRRNQYYWGIALLYIYSIMDAMVDAALSDFDAPNRYALEWGPEPTSLALTIKF